ncbi:uncharacterized protein [Diadema setosum]|uniref:uncharacterized protein n=1 Tax=Diadema setosum TaxID=31175 RepID=UPI003B3B15C3
MPKKREREEQPAKAEKHSKLQHQIHEKRMPEDQSGDVDFILRDIARDISENEDIENLGKGLGFTVAECQNFIKTNYRHHEITNEGTVCMLRKWSTGVSPSSLRSDLREALKRARLVRIADIHLPLGMSSPSSVPQVQPKFPDDKILQLLKNELRGFCHRSCRDVRTSPLHSKSSMKLEEIYTNLVMCSQDGDVKTDVNYNEFIDHLERIGTEIGLPTRIAIYGEADVGKTTFLAKLALDWALGKRLKTIDLVFLIHLREIEESICFGDTIMGNLSDELEIEGLELDKYIRTNQQKVLILYDGLDEYAKEISKSASNDDATIAVIRGEKFKNVRVIVTTRPWKKERIKSDTKLEKQYTFVEIEGFKPDDVSYYISKFFPHNEEARNSLISLMTDSESIVAQNMAPYPIYCSMLCFIWQNEGNRSVIQGLETFANFFDELIHHLKVHFAGKETDEEAQETKLVRGDDCLQNFGKDALSNLLRNQLVFGDKDLTVSDVDVKTACEIGVLTREEHFVSRRENNKRRTKRLVEYRIPHKLFQEYMAGLHLAWLYENNPEEFNQLNNKLIEDFEKFSYLLYFTAAQGVDVGKAVLSSLCKMLPDEEKLEFIIDVAFECHRLDALQPLIPYLNEKKSLSIRGPYHTASGWVYAWEACGYFASECSEYPGLTEKDNSTAIAARNAGRGICLLSNLTSLDLTTIQLHEDFFTGMSSMASQSKLESISHGGGPDLSAAASQAYAKSICTMPNLKALRLFDVGIADNFFISLAESAPGARLESISHGEGPDISATAAQAYAKSICTMPNLQSLELHSIGFADDFFLTLAASASGARLQSISHTAGPGLLAAASNAYAKSICTMHNLQTLELKDVSIADDFFLALASSAEGAKLLSISHTKGPGISASASTAYAKSVCTMPNLQALNLVDVSLTDDFFLALADSASGARLESIRHNKGPELSTSASMAYAKSVCTMPNLQTLKLDYVGTTDDFYLTLADLASGAKNKLSTSHRPDDKEDAEHENGFVRSPITHLCVEGNSVPLLRSRLGTVGGTRRNGGCWTPHIIVNVIIRRNTGILRTVEGNDISSTWW